MNQRDEMPGQVPTADPSRTQGLLPGPWAPGSKSWEMAVWEQAEGQQALAGVGGEGLPAARMSSGMQTR